MNAIISAQNLSKVYPGGLTGLSGVNLQVSAGEFIGIIGHSGAGKTTWLRLLNGTLLPSGGELKVLGNRMGRVSLSKLRSLRTRIAFLQQHHNTIPVLSVAENVLMGRLGKFSFWEGLKRKLYLPQSERQEIQEILTLLGIGEKINARCDELSGGEAQRVAVARVLFAQPEIILADEPIASVDEQNARIILDLFSKVNRRQGATILINLHQVDMALKHCHRVLVFDHGRLVYDGPPQDLGAWRDSRVSPELRVASFS